MGLIPQIVGRMAVMALATPGVEAFRQRTAGPATGRARGRLAATAQLLDGRTWPSLKSLRGSGLSLITSALPNLRS